MRSFIEDALALVDRITRAGYYPDRVWKLYKLLRGEPPVKPDGKIGRNLYLKERKQVTVTSRRNTKSRRRCVECGSSLGSRYTICPECGYDNTYAGYLGTKKN